MIISGFFADDKRGKHMKFHFEIINCKDSGSIYGKAKKWKVSVIFFSPEMQLIGSLQEANSLAVAKKLENLSNPHHIFHWV